MSITGGGTIVRCIRRLLYYTPPTGVRGRCWGRRIPVRVRSGCRSDVHACIRARAGARNGRVWVVGLRLMVVRRRAELVVTTTTRARTGLAIARGRGGSPLLRRVALS